LLQALALQGGRLYTAQHKFDFFVADFVASDFSFGRTLAADFAPLDCSGRQFVSTDWVEVHVKT